MNIVPDRPDASDRIRMAVFLPPSPAPQVVEYAKPRYGAEPTMVQSHGYRYVVTGNTLLPPATVQKILRTAATPKDALASLLKAYQGEGYPLVAITGKVEGKEVRIAVFQGMITELNTEDGLGWFYGSLSGRNDVRNDELLRRQIMAGLYAARSGKKVAVNLGPAANPDGSALDVTESAVPDYFPISGAVTFGNYGSRYSSGYVLGGDAAANLTHGVQITAGYLQGLPGLSQNSYGSSYEQGQFGASVVTPYGIYGISASRIYFRLGDATFPLNPKGDVDSFQLNGTQLVYADRATRASLTEALTRVSYKETVFNGLFTLLDQPYNYVSLGLNVNHSLTLGSLPGNLAGGISFNMGISGPAGTLVDGEPGFPTSHFRYTGLTLAYHQTLPLGFQADLTSQAQWAANTLPSQQQWILGGFGNLSAWEPGVVVGDSGYVTRLEIDGPALARSGASARLGGFLETGGSTFTTSPPGSPPWQTLSDAGLSLRLQLPYGFSATAMAATPISENGFDAIGNATLKVERMNAFFVVQKAF